MIGREDVGHFGNVLPVGNRGRRRVKQLRFEFEKGDDTKKDEQASKGEKARGEEFGHKLILA